VFSVGHCSGHCWREHTALLRVKTLVRFEGLFAVKRKGKGEGRNEEMEEMAKATINREERKE